MNIRTQLHDSYALLQGLAEVGLVGAIVILGVVLFYAPAAVFRGEAQDRWTYVAGTVGIGIWVLAIGTYAGAP